MEQIKEFTILSVEMEGFKRFSNPYEVKLGQTSYILGANGQGKTALADAIAYAFCGTPLWGEKNCDRLINHDCKKMSVTVRLVDGEGEIHTLTRSRSGKGSDIILDNCPVRQTDMVQRFADRDIFLSIFNPLYFVEKIADDGGELLKRLLPPVSRESVMAQLSENLRGILADKDIPNPASYIRSVREEIRGLEEQNARTEGQLDLLLSQGKEATASAETLEKEKAAVTQQIGALEQKQFYGLDVEALTRRKNEITYKRGEQLSALAEKKAALKTKLFVSPYEDKKRELNAALERAYARHRELRQRLYALKPGTQCPYCLTEITAENCEAVKTELHTELMRIVGVGKGIKKALAELKQLAEKSRVKFEEFRAADLKKVEDELNRLKIEDMEAAAIEDRLKLGNLTHAQYDELTGLKSRLVELDRELSVLRRADKSNAEAERLKGTLNGNRERIKELNILADAVDKYAAKQMELTVSRLKMDRAAIKLFDVVKSTGEIKDVFRFTYDGKDYRWLSASEKIRAGLEIAGLLKRLTGLTYPTFIDNAECIASALTRTEGQLICAFARPCELRVQTAPASQAEAA